MTTTTERTVLYCDCCQQKPCIGAVLKGNKLIIQFWKHQLHTLTLTLDDESVKNIAKSQ